MTRPVSSDRLLVFFARSGCYSLSEAAAKYGLPRSMIHYRISRGWPFDEIVRDRRAPRHAAEAEALAQCSVRELARAGIEWRICKRSRLTTYGRKRRTEAWLEKLTGYSHSHAVAMCKAAGLDWKCSTEAEIKRVVREHMSRRTVVTPIRERVMLTVDGARMTLEAFAARCSVDPVTMWRRYRRLKDWAVVIARSLARPGTWTGKTERRRREGVVYGRPPKQLEIDGVTRTHAEWYALIAPRGGLPVKRAAIHKAAKKSGRTIEQEIAYRVRSLREKEQAG